MAKRLHVVLQDSEYRQIQLAAAARGISTSEWVRQALADAQYRSNSSLSKKLEALRTATCHQFPVGDIGRMLSEIEVGYLHLQVSKSH